MIARSPALRRHPATAASLRLCLVLLVLGSACERPPMEVTQSGFRGVAIEKVTNPRIAAKAMDANQVPEPLPPAEPGPPAGDTWQNVQVLGDLSAGEFGRLMGAITQWVSPQQGCLYCHVAGNWASDEVYTKVVARKMIQMTQRINSGWKDHVRDTGATCYTCHRGQPVPAGIWTIDPGPSGGGFLGAKAGQNMPADSVGLASLPFDPFSPFLLEDESIRIQSGSALPTGSSTTIKDAEWTYALMIHFSESLGVNCTHCHNSRAFMPWEDSSPARVNAWYAIRMVREINEEYIGSLAHVFPENRKGPEGDVYKVHCGTCHQGLPKPLMGVSMLADYPNLAE